MKSSLALVAALAGLAPSPSATAQQFELGSGHLEYRIVADNTAVFGPQDAFIRLALQVRYVGGDMRATSFAATHGRIASNESDSRGILERASVRQAPYGNNDFGSATRQGMTESHRSLFTGGSANNNADQNGGNPNAASPANPHNGSGHFRWAPGLIGFGNLHAVDNPLGGIGRADTSGDGELISVGLIDDNNGTGDNTGIEPTKGHIFDSPRWDTIFLFNHTVTSDFHTFRIISFDYEPLGSPGNPGVAEDSVFWWNAATGGYSTSNAAVGVFRDDLSDDIYVAFPAPGAAALLALGGVAVSRRQRG